MKFVTKIALIAPFFLLVACDNNEVIEADPVVGEYELTLFNDLSMPISEVQTEVTNGILCDIERNGVVSFSENLDFSLTVRERLFNCTDLPTNNEESEIILGEGTAEEIGSSYSVGVVVDNTQVTLDCNLQGDNLFCQGESDGGGVRVEFQATRVE